MANLSIIRQLAKRKKIPLNELAELLDMSNTGLQRILNTNSTKIDTLEKIAEILDVPIHLFFQEDGNNEVQPNDFLSSPVSKMFINRFNTISDKLAFLKDYYVWEILWYLENNRVPIYPLNYKVCPKYLFDFKDENVKFTIALLKNGNYINTPFSCMTSVEKSIFDVFTNFFDGFYYPIFMRNMLNINDYLNEGIINDIEIRKYWNSYNNLIEEND